VRDQDKKIDEYFVPRPFDLKVFEEDIYPKKFKCFVYDIDAIDGIESLVARPIKFCFEG
jgi:hypothetical protein